MRLLLFKGPVESLNHFIDELNIQFQTMGHETLISDVTHFNGSEVMSFCGEPVQAVICYDGFCAFDREICNALNTTMINIFMDHPMSFASCMADPPDRYIQLMPDEHHIEFARRFYHIKNGFFLPHMASLSKGISQDESLEKKEISLLFPGGYRSVNELYRDINERFEDSTANTLALLVLEYLIANPSETMEGAFDKCVADNQMEMPDELMAYFLDHAKLLDHFIRMYYRSKVLGTIIKAGLPVTIVSEGWRAFPPAAAKNVTIMPGTAFTGIFPFMEKANITLNVMPWFKAGTHDRIFNALLHNSCPLTDKSTWLVEHLEENVECAYYSLEELDKLPNQIYGILNDPNLQRKIIRNGREKVLNNYTSRQIAGKILGFLDKGLE